MGEYLPLLATLVALLLGLVIGKAWERYKLRDGRWLDRRRLRDTPHYMLGLTFLVEGQVDRAIDELSHVAATDADALEIEMILGNLFREKGQVARAIAIHQTLLQRPTLTAIEHAHVLLCLGLDYRHAGFIDRAKEAFVEVRRLDPSNRHALVHLQRLHEEQRQFGAALKVREDLAALDPQPTAEDLRILGFLHDEIGQQLRASGDMAGAARAFTAAIDVDIRTTPAHLNLGDLREAQGDIRGAVDIWERLARALPDCADLVLERLERGYRTLGHPEGFASHCRQRLDSNPGDWRTRLAFARHLSAGGHHDDALEHLLDALALNPHGLALHQEAWTTLMALGLRSDSVQRYVAQTRNAVFYLDPHVCVRCHYRSTELLWLCPQCHEWNTFVEERIAPVKDSATFAAFDGTRAPDSR